MSRVAYLLFHTLPLVALLYLLRAAAERVIGLSLRYPPSAPVRRQPQYIVVLVVAGTVFWLCFQTFECMDCGSPMLLRLSATCVVSTVTGWIAHLLVRAISVFVVLARHS